MVVSLTVPYIVFLWSIRRIIIALCPQGEKEAAEHSLQIKNYLFLWPPKAKSADFFF